MHTLEERFFAAGPFKVCESFLLRRVKKLVVFFGVYEPTKQILSIRSKFNLLHANI